jgi:Flp pilus assembly protein TadD
MRFSSKFFTLFVLIPAVSLALVLSGPVWAAKKDQSATQDKAQAHTGKKGQDSSKKEGSKTSAKKESSKKESSKKESSKKETSKKEGSKKESKESRGKSKGKSKKEKKVKKHPAVVQSNAQAVKAAEEILDSAAPAKNQAGADKGEAAQAKAKDEPKSEAQQSYEKGMDLGRRNNYAQALDQFDQAIKLDPNNGGYYAGRGHANFMLNNLDKALTDYNKAISLNASDPLILVMRGHTHLKLHDYAKAVQDYDKAVQMGFSDPEVYKGRGFAYGQLNQPEKMCLDFQAACQKGDCEMLEKSRQDKICGNN